MYAKVYNLKFAGLSEAKVAATFCSENLGKKIVAFNIRSLNISIGQCGSVSISLKFETGGDLKKFDKKLTIADLETFVSMSAGLTPDKTETNRLVEVGLCKLTGEGALVFSTEGINLQRAMKLEAKPMKKIKMTGDDANKLIDQMFSELEQ